ncbi:hypothetical protein [Haloarcula rara]|uniref:hypothetical protein n=1 Tax=Haloarcula rara TaxID=3033387 RepID=UPI0023E8A144|nr:hypothetical protein [Halomicroarcula sp. SHR3]
MSDTRRSRPEVLAVGLAASVTDTLAAVPMTVTAVSDGEEALSVLADHSVSCLVVGTAAGSFTGIELALVARERHGVPAVVVGDGVPSRAADAAGVCAVCPRGTPTASPMSSSGPSAAAGNRRFQRRPSTR